MCVRERAHEHMSSGPQTGQKKILNALEVELQAVGSPNGGAENQLGSSSRAIYTQLPSHLSSRPQESEDVLYIFVAHMFLKDSNDFSFSSADLFSLILLSWQISQKLRLERPSYRI